jgi:hypothetical protein
MYGLRKIYGGGKDKQLGNKWVSDNTKFPMNIGAIIEAQPSWNPILRTGAIFCLPEARGGWWRLSGNYWCVLQYDEIDIIYQDSTQCRIKKCKLVFRSKNPKGLLKFFDASKFDSETAYQWAMEIGNRDIMIDRVTDSKWAYSWAMNIGDHHIMESRITDKLYLEIFNNLHSKQLK